VNKLPDRLDVVVFKYPGDRDFPITGPHRHHVPMNYIKRLIGLPGETIAIRGGNLYFLSPDKGLHYDDYDKAKNDPEMMATLWQKEPYMHVDDEQAVRRFEKGEFQIIRKDPETILSMMRLVYDNDHPSKNDPESAKRWISENNSGWSASAPHGFRHDGGKQGATDWLIYQHLTRDTHRPSLILDIMGYNTYQSFMHHDALLGNNWVGDLILECEAVIDSPQGELTLELSRGADQFQARWNLATGVCTLVRLSAKGEQELASKQTPLSKAGKYRLRFANVDEKLVVWVDEKLPFEGGVPYPASEQLGPRKEHDLDKPASIGVRGAGVAVHKLKLFRDTYYTVGGGRNNSSPAEPDVRIVPTNPDDDGWRDLRNPPLLTLYVQPDHFLCLGDNSPESSDGRSWGAVPRRLLLGRALLVYWPFGRAGRIR
jgi:signal peptidase I